MWARTILRVLIAVLLGLCIVAVSFYYGLAEHDRSTRLRIMEQIAREVPPGADAQTMEAFMKRHTASYSLDDRFDHQYGGILEQSWLDHLLGERKVIIRLRFNPDRTYKDAEVIIAYRTL